MIIYTKRKSVEARMGGRLELNINDMCYLDDFSQLFEHLVGCSKSEHNLYKNTCPHFNLNEMNYETDGLNLKHNILSSTGIILDIDENLTIKEASLIFNKYNNILYTSHSHSAQHHKFRIILELEQPLYNLEELECFNALFKERYKKLFENNEIDNSTLALNRGFCEPGPNSHFIYNKNKSTISLNSLCQELFNVDYESYKNNIRKTKKREERLLKIKIKNAPINFKNTISYYLKTISDDMKLCKKLVKLKKYYMDTFNFKEEVIHKIFKKYNIDLPYEKKYDKQKIITVKHIEEEFENIVKIYIKNDWIHLDQQNNYKPISTLLSKPQWKNINIVEKIQIIKNNGIEINSKYTNILKNNLSIYTKTNKTKYTSNKTFTDKAEAEIWNKTALDITKL